MIAVVREAGPDDLRAVRVRHARPKRGTRVSPSDVCAGRRDAAERGERMAP